MNATLSLLRLLDQPGMLALQDGDAAPRQARLVGLDRIHQVLGCDVVDANWLRKRVNIIGPVKREIQPHVLELIRDALTWRRRVHLRCLMRAHGEISERDISQQRLVHVRNICDVDAW